MLILPGGPGTTKYRQHESFLRMLNEHHSSGGCIAAICAAPSVLGMLGLLRGKRAVCFPGFEAALEGAIISNRAVETDGNIITSKGAGTALLFAFQILRVLKGAETVETVRGQIQEPALREAYMEKDV
jgi:4-methyl-5(b-hydroxyethyl)-thiazole monophosphate biosynthesis